MAVSDNGSPVKITQAERLVELETQIVNLRAQVDHLIAQNDILGQQLNWLCENTTNLFALVNQVSAMGPGALMGLMKGAGE